MRFCNACAIGFKISVELSDADVETVTRRVVLAKKADKKESHRGDARR